MTVPKVHSSLGGGRVRIGLAGGLMIGSAALQHLAAVGRWSVAAPLQGHRSIEDHLFDYSWPTDPWVNVGTSAQLFGVGSLVLALAVLAAFGTGRGRSRVVSIAGIVVALAFGLIGLHALMSGILDAPSFLRGQVAGLVVALAAPVGLVVVAAALHRTSMLQTVSCVLLLGATLPGYLVATFAIAPVLAGDQSFDTTPWTESVVAAAVAAAGVLLLLDAAARPSLRRTSQDA